MSWLVKAHPREGLTIEKTNLHVVLGCPVIHKPEQTPQGRRTVRLGRWSGEPYPEVEGVQPREDVLALQRGDDGWNHIEHAVLERQRTRRADIDGWGPRSIRTGVDLLAGRLIVCQVHVTRVAGFRDGGERTEFHL